MTIKDLRAGPELDALIAENVMGWDIHFKLKPGERPHHEGVEHFRDHRNNTLYLPGQWTPSTNLEAAFEVVTEIGRGLALHWDPDGKTLDAFRDDKDLSDRTREAYSGTGSWVAGIGGNALIRAETASLAICMAALRAMEHQSTKR